MDETTVNEIEETNTSQNAENNESASEVTFDESAELVDVISDEEDEEVEVIISPYDRKGKWYVLHSYAGYENRVQQNIETRMRSMNVEERSSFRWKTLSNLKTVKKLLLRKKFSQVMF